MARESGQRRSTVTTSRVIQRSTGSSMCPRSRALMMSSMVTIPIICSPAVTGMPETRFERMWSCAARMVSCGAMETTSVAMA